MDFRTTLARLSEHFEPDSNYDSTIWLYVRNFVSSIVVVTTLTVAFSLATYADRRNYVWTYQYVTMPKNATELEFYQTTKLKDEADDWEYRIEVEHGLTNRWDFSLYQIFKQKEGDAFKWDAVQFRTRYRIAEEGILPIDPLLYFEYKRRTDSTAENKNKLEAKLILAKTLSKLNIAVNPLYEVYLNHKQEIGLDAGISWEWNPKLVLGLESTSRINIYKDGSTKSGSYLGPTVSVASGGWWYAVGTALGLTDDSDQARVRFIMGIDL
ncbi:MAG: hypothetical protein QGI86_13060 [Candidatus Poribacteria bacterium]|jgi:hypothetical protein|nr:hypothetical protein [Candidatus Poribacteria bacterium]MDP6751896.1 hypothetical protein [Candidatus Poribacteria bacterium]MDP6998677.1 hypothetical protein [Candidatus Poribacteria bacterium]